MTELEEFLERLDSTSDFSRRYVEKSYKLIRRIKSAMRRKGWEQKDLASALEKNESEISKWMSGTHNFTWKSIMKIEEALEYDLVKVPDDKVPRIAHTFKVLFINEEIRYESRPVLSVSEIAAQESKNEAMPSMEILETIITGL